MIASVSGRILESGDDYLVVGVGGVGLLVYVPAPLKEISRPGDEVKLFTYLVLRQDSLSLYGFESQEERYLFELLLAVNGVGPLLALAVLSTLSPDAIRRAVVHEQPEVFNRVPGVGKKTAQKILLQLGDKIGAVSELETVSAYTDVDTEVISALTTLGYSIVEAQAALQSIPRDTPQDVEERLKLALAFFA
jgi:Holliday junction DNA helicase RuvA